MRRALAAPAVRTVAVGALLLGHLPLHPAPAADARLPNWTTARFASAVASFRQARFAEAYGRFVELAEVGHAPAARYALWMCEHGADLFGRPWDCAPHEIEAWALLNRTDPQEAVRRIYPALAAEPAKGARRR